MLGGLLESSSDPFIPVAQLPSFITYHEDDILYSNASLIEILFREISERRNSSDAINKLIRIANNQNFKMTQVLFDILFSVYDSLTEQCSSSSHIGCSISLDCISSAYKTNSMNGQRNISQQAAQVLVLIDRIASFHRFWISGALKKRHLLALWNLIPNPAAVKALGKFIAMDPHYCKFVASLGIKKIVSYFRNQKSLFLWFLGCFAGTSELNDHMLEYYEKYVMNSCLSEDLLVARHAHDVVRILSGNSYEMKHWLLCHKAFPQMMVSATREERTFQIFIDALEQLIDENTIESLIRTPEFIQLLECALNSEQQIIVFKGIKIITYRYSLGFSRELDERRFDLSLFKFCCDDTDFRIKKESLKGLCYFIASIPANKHAEYLTYNYLGIIQESLELCDAELEIAAIKALCAVWHRCSTYNDTELLDTLDELVDIARSLDSDIVSTVFQ